MAKKKKRRTAGRRATDKKKAGAVPGWVYMLMGLSIGLAVAFAVYVSDRERLAAKNEVSLSDSEGEPASTIPEVIGEVVDEFIEDEPDAGITFDFYDMLPNLDVEIFEDERAPAITKPKPVEPVSREGIYILQAGSFSRLEDANRRKAEMALLGVRSEIKKGIANERDVYRVYTEPMNNPTDVNRVSNKLTGANIEIMLKRVSD